ncbi:GNAT family N-acetyltransferase [Variovorax rhizosphaerae]|uniref:GNAT family N-acetyltransferase n=1 Tax=Variovorax rhizosphaerae TaxID=1836200 RepID=A0ABU8WDA6_9BURK
MTSEDIEAIERATLAAVAPHTVEEFDGWLLPFDHGTVGRAKSAVPLRHEAPRDAAGLLAAIEARYAYQGLPAAFRMADLPCFDALRGALLERNYQRGKPTLTQTSDLRSLVALAPEVPADVDTTPDAGWASVFLGEGFDPVDGASRVQALSRAAGTLFGSVREDGRTVAAGALALSHGWASLHGMRTQQSARGRGLAGRVMAGLAQAALALGYERVFLQVEAGNAPAQALYRRAGFLTQWTYEYWTADRVA